jgi:hypothetical protein
VKWEPAQQMMGLWHRQEPLLMIDKAASPDKHSVPKKGSEAQSAPA